MYSTFLNLNTTFFNDVNNCFDIRIWVTYIDPPEREIERKREKEREREVKDFVKNNPSSITLKNNILI